MYPSFCLNYMLETNAKVIGTILLDYLVVTEVRFVNSRCDFPTLEPDLDSVLPLC